MEKNLEENSKDKFLFDTSAFLSIESIHLLDRIIDLFSVITTPLVLRELDDFAQHEDVLGLIAERVLAKRNRFLLKETTITEKLDYVSSIDKELFNMSLRENITLITDDLKLLRHTTGKIKRAFSTYFLTDFVHAGILTKEEALAKLEAMRDIRNWQDNIIYLSTKEILENIKELSPKFSSSTE